MQPQTGKASGPFEDERGSFGQSACNDYRQAALTPVRVNQTASRSVPRMKEPRRGSAGLGLRGSGMQTQEEDDLAKARRANADRSRLLGDEKKVSCTENLCGRP